MGARNAYAKAVDDRAALNDPEKANAAFDILLVEDDGADARLIKRAFERLLDRASFPHFRVTTVPRLRDAVAMLEDKVFDAAVLDLNLLDTSGIASLIGLNAVTTSYTPIVVYSGAADRDTQEEAVLCGAYRYMSKNDSTTEELTEVVREAMGFAPD